MILCFYTWRFNIWNAQKVFLASLDWFIRKKEYLMAVKRHKRKRGKSKSRSKDARWTPCLPPGLFLRLSVLPPSDDSPSWIKYPWKDGLLFSIVLNNRHNQQIRQVHHIDSNPNIQLCGQRNKADEAAHTGGPKSDTVSPENITL